MATRPDIKITLSDMESVKSVKEIEMVWDMICNKRNQEIPQSIKNEIAIMADDLLKKNFMRVDEALFGVVYKMRISNFCYLSIDYVVEISINKINDYYNNECNLTEEEITTLRKERVYSADCSKETKYDFEQYAKNYFFTMAR